MATTVHIRPQAVELLERLRVETVLKHGQVYQKLGREVETALEAHVERLKRERLEREIQALKRSREDSVGSRPGSH